MALIRQPHIREELKRDLAQCLRESLYYLHDTPVELAEGIIAYLEKKGWHGVKDDNSPPPLHHSSAREAEENGVAE